jgi:hypothetical protein
VAIKIEVAVPHHSDPLPQSLAVAAFAPETLALLERVLTAQWDPDGTVAVALARRPVSHDPTRPRSLADVAREVAGLLSAGGGEAEVGGYLKREELALFGPLPEGEAKERRRARRERVRESLWRAVRGISRPDDLKPLPQDTAAT